MKIKKIISLLLLAGTVLTQVPAVGMDAVQRQREDRRNNKRLFYPRIGIGLVGLVSAALASRRLYNDANFFYHNPMAPLIYALPLAVAGVEGAAVVTALAWFTNFPAPLQAFLYSIPAFGVATNTLARNDDSSNVLNLRPLFRSAAKPGVHTRAMIETLNTDLSNIDAQDNEGKTKLINAILSADFEAFSRFITRGASLDIKDNQQKNALMHAIDADDIEMVRMLLVAGADKQESFQYLRSQMRRYYREISELLAAGPGLNAVRINRLNEDFAILKKIKPLFEFSFAQLLEPLMQEQKDEYKKMFLERDKVRPSLHGSLMLYEFFGERASLVGYLKDAVRFKSKMSPNMYEHMMSFARKELKVEDLRKQNVLRKAIIKKDQQLMMLLTMYGIKLPHEERIAAQFN